MMRRIDVNDNVNDNVNYDVVNDNVNEVKEVKDED
jgi:hypothetical protein